MFDDELAFSQADCRARPSRIVSDEMSALRGWTIYRLTACERVSYLDSSASLSDRNDLHGFDLASGNSGNRLSR
jgi:hypothetical protein